MLSGETGEDRRRVVRRVVVHDENLELLCRQRLPGETFERPQQVGRAIESGYDDRERNHIREF